MRYPQIAAGNFMMSIARALVSRSIGGIIGPGPVLGLGGHRGRI